MRTIKLNKRNSFIIIVLLSVICLLAVTIPSLVHAGSEETWVEHLYQAGHVSITSSGESKTFEFSGYRTNEPFDYVLCTPQNNKEEQLVSIKYTIDASQQFPHSCDGYGFLFNADYFTNDGGGYYLMMSESNVYLMYLKELPYGKNGLYQPGTIIHDNTPAGYTEGSVAYVPPYKSPLKYRVYKQHQGENAPGGLGYQYYEDWVISQPADYFYGEIDVQYSGTDKLIKKTTVPYSSIYKVDITASSNHATIIVNGQTIYDSDLPYATVGHGYGPAVQYNYHECPQTSRIKFTQVITQANITPPIADFEYNAPVVDMRQTVFVTDLSKDTNSPKSPLTYFWTVQKINSSGTKTTVYPTNSVKPTKYNEWGVGTYITTLKVVNGYGLSDEVSKEVEIIQNPTINIVADKEKYSPGEKVTFKCNKWYNCNISPADITITNIVSDNLFNPTVFLVGSNGMTSASGNLSASVKFVYMDGTTSTKSVSIPPSGLTTNDAANEDKAVKEITIVYKGLSNQIDLKPDSYILYSYETLSDLSVYFTGGINPRSYEITNSATITIELPSGPASANSSAKTNLIEGKGILSLQGIVDNNNAITEPPECNTEFLLTGTSIGGETISKYIVVTKGESDAFEISYGNYIITEEPDFAVGYDDIAPIKVTVNKDGIVVDEKVTITNGKIPFTKVLQTAKITANRTYKSEYGINIESDTDFKATLTGTTVVKGIAASFELTSPKSESVYYYDDKTVLTLPIGSYILKETQSYRLVSLEDISVAGEVKWNRVLNTKDASDGGKANFVAEKDKTIPVVLKYVSDECVVYDEYEYKNSIHFDISTINSKNNTIVDEDIAQIMVDPSEYKYPIRLINTATGEDYYGIMAPETGITFKYMRPGEYQIICSDNMYMNFDRLEEINSDNIDFYEKNGKSYVAIPESSASGEYKETSKLTNWRGYSNLSSVSSIMETETYTHVSLALAAADQEKNHIANLKVRFVKDGEPIYFIKKYQKWYPAEGVTDGATDILETDNYGDINIYKFPEGEYVIEQVSPIDSLTAVSLPQTIIVDGTRNVGINVLFANESRIISPSFITLTALKSSIDINETLNLSDKISPSTASKDITYSTSDSNIATVSSPDGVVTGKKVGTVIIKATSDKDKTVIGEYEITVYDSSNPAMANLKQTISNIKLEVGESYKASVTYSPSTVRSPAIVWTSSNPSIATVSPDGTIRGVAVGTADVTAKYGELTAICRVTVGKTFIPVREVTLDKDYLTLIYNNSTLAQGSIKATVSPDDASNTAIVFASSSPDIVSVDADGNLTAKAAGTAVITATATNGISQSCIVSSVPIIDTITLDSNALALTEGSIIKIKAEVSPNGSQNKDSLVWKSSDPNIVSVDNNGTITTKQIGRAIISLASSYPGSNDVIAECQVDVVTDKVAATGINIYIPTENIAVTQPLDKDFELSIGGSIIFMTDIVPSTATDTEIEWSYSRPGVVTIEPANPDTFNPNNSYNSYKIVASDDIIGEVTVTGKIKGTDITTQFKVIVSAPGTSVELTKQGTQELFLDVVPELTVGVQWEHSLAEVQNISWALSDNSKASLSVSENKKEVTITALEEGTVTLTAEVEFKIGGTHSASIEIDIKEPVVEVFIDGVQQQAITRKNKPTYDVVLETDESIDITFKPNYPLTDKAYYDFYGDEYADWTKNDSDANVLKYTITGSTPTHTLSLVQGMNGALNGCYFGTTIPGMYIRVYEQVEDSASKLSTTTYGCLLPGDDGHWASENKNIISIVSGSESVSSNREDVVDIESGSDGTAAITYTCSSYVIHATFTVENGVVKLIESEVVPLPKELVINPHYWSERG